MIRKEIPANQQRYPPGCPDPHWCSGNGLCYWQCNADPDEGMEVEMTERRPGAIIDPETTEHPGVMLHRLLVEKHNFILEIERQRALLDRARIMVANLRRDADVVPGLDVVSVLDEIAALLNGEKS